MNYSLYKKPLLLALPFIIGAFVSFSILDNYSQKKVKTKLDEFALGAETSVNMALVENVQIHCHDLANFDKCLDGYRSDDIKDVALWLGNSQVHAINQMQSGDETAVPYLHRFLRDFGYYFLTFSQPNASLQEHYLFFEYLLNQFPVKVLVLPIVFDDMRETGIRPTLEDALSDERVATKLASTSIGKKLLANFGDKDSAGNDMAALEDTFQERTERFLNHKLAEYWAIWSARAKIRGQIYVFLYKFRNRVFGINPSSVRKIIPGRYSSNKAAFEAILDTAQSLEIKVLVYVVPLRNDVPIPYDLGEYEKYKREMQSLSERDGVRFVNLENLIPGDLWGTKKSTSVGGGQELDFMHFKAEGHKLLAKSLAAEVSGLMEKKSRQ